jgi:uncharacterized protein (TIGR03083 family)
MQLTPRYEGTPVLRLDPPVADPRLPLLRQRRRLNATLAGFGADRWAAPSRCAGWACRDVVSHLVSVNSFWAASVTAGRTGAPTRFLVGFDPVATPAQMVAGAPEVPDGELLDRLTTTTESLAEALDGLDAAGWAQLAEAPPGHLAISEVAVHALWDAWIHERDICLPLGIDVPTEDDEVDAVLRYAVSIGPALQTASGADRTGAFRVRAVDPAVDLVVEVGPDVVVRAAGAGDDGLPEVRGSAVDLVESFSLRSAPPELTAGDRWLVDALATAFDQAGQPDVGTDAGGTAGAGAPPAPTAAP